MYVPIRLGIMLSFLGLYTILMSRLPCFFLSRLIKSENIFFAFSMISFFAWRGFWIFFNRYSSGISCFKKVIISLKFRNTSPFLGFTLVLRCSTSSLALCSSVVLDYRQFYFYALS